MDPKLIIILGPTASGKSDLGVTLAKEFDGEIINADSRQIYRDMIIGTASPIAHAAGTVDGIRHHLFNFVSPREYFSVAEYKSHAVATVQDIGQRAKIPFLVGGTGLYIWVIVDNLMIPEVPANPALRAELESQNTEKLLEELKEKDPEAVPLTDKNKRRIIRALEVILATGKKFTKVRKPGEKLFETLRIGLSLPMDELDKRIQSRAENMLRDGLIEEVEGLLKKYPPDLSAFDSPGYREFIQYIQGNLSLSEATDQFIRAHKQLARRQMKWFKRDKRIQWFSPHSIFQIKERIENFLD